MNLLLLAVVVLSWGLSWYAIAIQVGTIPVEASIAYRFGLAGTLILAWRWFGTGTIVVPWRRQGALAVMGLCLFSLNFVLIYSATAFIVSGLVSVVFASAALMGAVNVWIFDGVRPGGRVVTGAAAGMLGLALLYLGVPASDSPTGASATSGLGPAAIGLLLALGGTYCFSLGNVVSTRVRGHVDFVTGTGWAMLHGAAFAALVCLMRHGTLPPPPFTPDYLGSLAYLVLGASVIGFLVYLDLVRRVGAARAAYATVLFPLVALAVSSILEDYVWTIWAVLGVVLVLGGAALVFARPKALQE